MGIFRNRRARGLVGLAAAGAMTLSLAACGGNAAPFSIHSRLRER